MWQIKTFKTKTALNKFIKANQSKYQITQIFIDNAYAVEYRKLRRI